MGTAGKKSKKGKKNGPCTQREAEGENLQKRLCIEQKTGKEGGGGEDQRGKEGKKKKKQNMRPSGENRSSIRVDQKAALKQTKAGGERPRQTTKRKRVLKNSSIE